MMGPPRGVEKFFKTLAKLASRPAFSLTKTENNWPKIKKGLAFSLAKTEK
jgi:hypothetical protein